MSRDFFFVKNEENSFECHHCDTFMTPGCDIFFILNNITVWIFDRVNTINEFVNRSHIEKLFMIIWAINFIFNTLQLYID